MKLRPIILLVLVPLLCGAIFVAGAELRTFEVEKDGSDIVVSWEANTEDGVREYELFRQTPFTNGHVHVRSIPAHGPRKMYRYRDTEVYKNAADMIDYRLDVVFDDGSRQQVRSAQVAYTSTAVRRTWGSIKAMFQ